MSNENSKTAVEVPTERHVRIQSAVDSIRSVISRVESITARAGYSEPRDSEAPGATSAPMLFDVLNNAPDELLNIEQQVNKALDLLESRLF